MKRKTVSLVVVAALLLSMLTGWGITAAAADTPEGLPVLKQPQILGNVSGSGTVEPLDALLVLQALVDKINLNGDQMTAARVSGNEYLQVVDARLILQYILGLITSFPADDPVFTGEDNNFNLPWWYDGPGGTLIAPDTQPQIGSAAYAGYAGLTNLIIPEDITAVGAMAFAYCCDLAAVDFGYFLRSIDFFAFAHCDRLTDIILPLFLEEIGAGAFYRCTGLTEITIPNDVEDIDHGAFMGCSGLKTVKILNKKTQFGQNVFAGCHDDLIIRCYKNSTAHAYALENGIDFEFIDTFFWGDYAYEISKSEITIHGYYGQDIHVTVPTVLDGKPVTAIGVGAFSGNRTLVSVTIPASIKKIDTYASYPFSSILFAYCENLLNIHVDADNPAYADIGGVLCDKAGTTLFAYPPGRKGTYTVPKGIK
ncbi:MAG: leucine-rich repeat domain-containing protein, partial [Oscillospiraceae bacterium]|nr:leucine-rich repeat domain-containing protein [Oscillospiraceae bacterium]